jgi:hypothetical protein
MLSVAVKEEVTELVAKLRGQTGAGPETATEEWGSVVASVWPCPVQLIHISRASGSAHPPIDGVLRNMRYSAELRLSQKYCTNTLYSLM